MKAKCTWGDGPDVLVVLDGMPVMLYHTPVDFNHAKHGMVKQGSFDLTADEAIALALQLLRAAESARDMDRKYQNAWKCADGEDQKENQFKCKTCGRIRKQHELDQGPDYCLTCQYPEAGTWCADRKHRKENSVDRIEITEAPKVEYTGLQDDGWYFYDDCQQPHGPYGDKREAQFQLDRYCAIELEGKSSEEFWVDWVPSVEDCPYCGYAECICAQRNAEVETITSSTDEKEQQ